MSASHDDSPEHLFNRIRNARVRSGLTKEEAAAALGVSKVQIWRLENKSNTVSAERLFEIADLYGIDPRKLLHGEDAAETPLRLYTRIGEVVAMVEQEAQRLDVKPPPHLVGEAVVEILRQETKDQSIPDTDPLDTSKYQGLVSLLFRQASNT
jgi:transcriptional regulator with XRE-family HTH domain